MNLGKKLTDVVRLVKENGVEIENIEAHVATDSVIVRDTSISVEVGDTLIQELPNNTSRKMKVIDVVHHKRKGTKPEVYVIKIKPS